MNLKGLTEVKEREITNSLSVIQKNGKVFERITRAFGIFIYSMIKPAAITFDKKRDLISYFQGLVCF